MSRLTVVPAAPETAFARLVVDYLQDRRAGGVSPKTIAIYADALGGVLLPFCVAHAVSEPVQLTNRVLNDLGAGLLDGSLSRRGRPLSKATVHSYMRAVNREGVAVTPGTGGRRRHRATGPAERYGATDAVSDRTHYCRRPKRGAPAARVAS